MELLEAKAVGQLMIANDSVIRVEELSNGPAPTCSNLGLAEVFLAYFISQAKHSNATAKPLQERF